MGHIDGGKSKRNNGDDTYNQVDGIPALHELFKLGGVPFLRFLEKSLVLLRGVVRCFRNLPDGGGSGLINASDLRSHALAQGSAHLLHARV